MMAGFGGIAGRLYRGEVSVEFVRRQRMWYSISGIILLVSVVAVFVRKLNFSVDFRGGSIFQFPAATGAGSAAQAHISRIVSGAGGGDSIVQLTTSRLLSQWNVTTKALSLNVQQSVGVALERAFHLTPAQMQIQYVGPTWGGQITTKAVEALIIFLVVIVIYLSIAFEWRMAVAAFIALLHDIVITIGVYALTGFQVSPTTVIGLLTILGYSLYDTVVVFDKVRENTAGLLTSQRSTYSDAANLALNQTLVRSINTSLTALIPVASILFVGAGLLGAGTLKDLALVLFVGMLSGAYSSICIATPVLADLKERQPEYKDLAVKVKRRLAGGRKASQRVLAAELAEDDLVDDNLIDRPGTGRLARDHGTLTGPAEGVLEDDASIREDLDDSGDGDDVTVPPRPRGADRPHRVNRQQRVTPDQRRGSSSRKKRR
ncbi:MAG TPA: protein translocase subunit SecF [Trebonia sp.]|jgi:preprotein translocase subunit SecF|nr:protein translocase subunit SecF [Trebonia sp.]